MTAVNKPTIKTGPLGAQSARQTQFNISDNEVLQYLKPLVAEKKVLDLGCVDHSLKEAHQDRIWTHDLLVSVANEVVGVDKLEKEIGELKQLGYRVICQDVEKLEIDEKFDVVFAGELIEHLSNPGLFLEKVRPRLKPLGLLILTTPNVFSVQRLVSILAARSNDPFVNPEHCCWFSPSTIRELLSRYGFRVKSLTYAHFPNRRKNWESKLVRGLTWFLGHRFKEVMLVVAQAT